MRKYLLAAAAVSAISTPAIARDGQGYAGLEAGVAWVKDQNADVFVDFTTVDNPIIVGGTPALPAPPVDTLTNNVFNLDNKMGYDIGVFGGYDFGGFRVEGEIDWKHAKLDDLRVDTPFLDFLNALDDATANDLIDSDFDIDNNVGALSFMINGLADFGDQDGLSFQAGGGIGWSKVKMLNDKDGAFSWQAILGLNYALSPSMDLGLRGKYFSTGSLNFADGDVARNSFVLTQHFIQTPPGGVPTGVTRTTTADVFSDVDAKFRAWTLVAALTFNFGEAAPPPPPPPPPPAPERGR